MKEKIEITKPKEKGFHLYFAGTQNKDSEKLIEDENNFRLLSYVNDQTQLRQRREKGLLTFVDSGAFTAYKQGTEIDIDEYIKWLNEHDEYVLIAAELDKMPGKVGHPRTREITEEAAKVSWENYIYMIERVKSPDKILPIFHQGEDFRHLERMLNHTPAIDYIGLSPSQMESTRIKEVWITHCFEVIHASKNPHVKTHAFGMTSLKVLERQPFTSADSTSWIMVGSNGSIMTPNGTILVSEQGKGQRTHIDSMPKTAIKKVKEYAGKYGYTLEELRTCYKARIGLNIKYLTEWTNNYEYTPLTIKQKRLF